MRRAIILALMAVSAFSIDLYADTDTCGRSFALGKQNAKLSHKSWPWFFVGLGSLYLAARTFDTIVMIEDSSQSSATALPWIGFTIVIAMPFIPAIVMFPNRNKINPSEEGLDLDCYRNGYLRKARQKNLSALLLGDSIAFAAAIALASIIFDRDWLVIDQSLMEMHRLNS